ncbi:MAG: hypothetical protein JST81_10700 [Bacteroidetes bacterium]|jgi:uncharacterized membrane-anchored protein|nr:hypothetical protein [Bacteroidota bacterium]
MIGKFLLAAWKFILIGLVALGAGIKKLFRKKNTDNSTIENTTDIS